MCCNVCAVVTIGCWLVQSRLSYLLLSALCIEVLWAVLWGAVLCAVFFEVCVLVLLFMCGCVHRLLVVQSRLSLFAIKRSVY